MSPVVFVPIAADFQRGILGTSTKEAKDKEGDEDQWARKSRNGIKEEETLKEVF